MASSLFACLDGEVGGLVWP